MEEIPQGSIDGIIFGIYSAEEIIKNSVCKLTSCKISGEGSVYDAHMGVLDNDKKCLTCEKECKDCPGHNGHIELNVPVIHPLCYKEVIAFLKCFCFQCYQFILDEQHIILDGTSRFRGKTRFNRILEKIKRVDDCYHCKSPKMKITFCNSDTTIQLTDTREKRTVKMSDEEVLKIFSNITESDIRLLGFDPELVHPKNFVITVLQVLPPISRPYIINEGSIHDDDLTVQYLEIVKLNNHLSDPNLAETKRSKHIQTVKFRIKTLMNNSKGKARSINNRPLKGIKERLTGKEGLIRNNLMGKRTNQSGRTVIGPDPFIRTDELVVPEIMAKNLTVPERVNSYNFNYLSELVNSGKANYVLRNDGKVRINLKYATQTKSTEVKKGDRILRNGVEIDPDATPTELRETDIILRGGKQIPVSLRERKHFKLELDDIVERHLKNGDSVLINRQPTLHKGSMLAKKAIIRPGKTLRFSLASTKTFNADKLRHCQQQRA